MLPPLLGQPKPKRVFPLVRKSFKTCISCYVLQRRKANCGQWPNLILPTFLQCSCVWERLHYLWAWSLRCADAPLPCLTSLLCNCQKIPALTKRNDTTSINWKIWYGLSNGSGFQFPSLILYNDSWAILLNDNVCDHLYMPIWCTEFTIKIFIIH